MTSETTNKRNLAKLKTRQRVVDAARSVWAAPGSFDVKGIRDVAGYAGLSTGAVFANFENKEALWCAAFGCPAPTDSALTRAAPELRRILQNLVEQRPEVFGTLPAPIARDWEDAERIIEQLKDYELAQEQDLAA